MKYGYMKRHLLEEFEKTPTQFLERKISSQTYNNPLFSKKSTLEWIETWQTYHDLKWITERNSDFGAPNEPYSGNTIEMFYHMCNIERMLGNDLWEMDGVTIIGGGYGNLGRILKTQNKDMRVKIVDHAEVRMVQSHYLTNTLPLTTVLPELKVFNAVGLNPHSRDSMLFITQDLPTPDWYRMEEFISKYGHFYIYQEKNDREDDLIVDLQDTYMLQWLSCPIDETKTILLGSRK